MLEARFGIGFRAALRTATGAARLARAPRDPQLADRRERDALMQHLETLPLDFIEARERQRRLRAQHALRGALRGGNGRERIVQSAAGALCLKTHEIGE